MNAAAFLAAAEALPVGDFDQLVGEGGLVVVAPHPDDESLGCGGLIAEACARGRPVRVMIVSDGCGSHTHSATYPPDRLRALRETETLEAVVALGLGRQHVQFLRLPDGNVPPSGPEAEAAATAIVAAADEIGASALFVTWGHDPHRDHKASAAIVTLAGDRLGTKRVFAYPIWGWTLPEDLEVGAPPQGQRLDITAHLPAKAAAIAAHRSQITDLIADDPSGFRLEPAMLARFARPYEIFIALRPDSAP